MSRRLLGPVGGPVVFLLVAALVFAGLGWVTYTALGVERAQRHAAAEAEMGNRLRDALWRLDGRLLPVLAAEDSRPFFHYDSADPDGLYGPAATPLLSATLPGWMKLHFRLDPAAGWRSNQAPVDPAEADRIRRAWPELPLQNLYGDRRTALDELKAKFPVRATCELFAARDRALPSNSLPLAAPLFAEVDPIPDPALKPPPVDTPAVPTKPTPDAAETVCVLGFDLCARPTAGPAQQQAGGPPVANDPRFEPDASEKKTEQGKARSLPPVQGGVSPRGGRGQKDAEADRGWADFVNRAQTFNKGLQESKQAYDDPYSRNPGNYLRNSAQYPLDQRNAANILPVQPPAGPVFANPLPTIPPGATPAQPGMPVPPTAAPQVGAAGGFGLPSVPPIVPSPAAPAAQAGDRLAAQTALTAREALALERQNADVLRTRAGSGAGAAVWFGWPRDRGVTPVVPAGVDHPAPVPLQPPPVSVHLGSLRPQWVTAPDGTEMLVLVRTARFDARTVYQGIVLDWEKLRAELKAEVEQLFPGARLLPVKNPDGVPPGRAMTALPVQLDTGPEAELPPAGWTPLRIGLVLAWAAALLAVVAVGFSGWSLIDLAERRIRFVSAVTHELRTPLTSLRLYLDLLVSGMIQDEEKRREYLNTLATESDRLHRLIDNVLDYARLEKRRKDGDVKPVNVADLLAQIRLTWTDRVAQDGMELVVVSELPPGCEVSTDAGMVQQIVGNLIDNARKYTRDAADRRIWLRARPAGRGVALEVEDRGPGVPAGERKTIFKPFRRGSCADSKAGGAGLGLALAKSWAEVLGARLAYRPADGGVGACFRMELPGK